MDSFKNTLNLILDKLNSIDTRVSSLEKKVDLNYKSLEANYKNLKISINDINATLNKQSIYLENELTSGVYKSLVNTYPNTLFIVNEPDLLFPKNIVLNGKKITDIDGLIIATNIPWYYEYLRNYLDKKLSKELTVLNKNNPLFNQLNKEKYLIKKEINSTIKPDWNNIIDNQFIKLIIIESKYNLTMEEFIKKKEQKEVIENYINNIKNNNIILRQDDQLNILGIKYIESEVGLYIGGYNIDTNVVDQINSFIIKNQERKNKLIPSFFGKVVMTDSRFGIIDDSKVPGIYINEPHGYSLLKGGKYKKKNSRNIIIHN